MEIELGSKSGAAVPSYGVLTSQPTAPGLKTRPQVTSPHCSYDNDAAAPAPPFPDDVVCGGKDRTQEIAPRIHHCSATAFASSLHRKMLMLCALFTSNSTHPQSVPRLLTVLICTYESHHPPHQMERVKSEFYNSRGPTFTVLASSVAYSSAK